MKDIVGLYLDPPERAIVLSVDEKSQHERIPEIAAAAFSHHLFRQADGCRKIAAMIADDVSSAVATGNQRHPAQLKATLEAFLRMHPEAWTSLRAQACLGRLAHATA